MLRCRSRLQIVVGVETVKNVVQLGGLVNTSAQRLAEDSDAAAVLGGKDGKHDFIVGPGASEVVG